MWHLTMYHSLQIHPGELVVLGYLGPVLRSIRNESDRPALFDLHIDNGEPQIICLAAKETLQLDVDIWRCIRDRYMPYIERPSESHGPLALCVNWDDPD